METREVFLETFKAVEEKAVELFIRDGYLQPVTFIIMDGEGEIVVGPVGEGNEKRQWYQALADRFRGKAVAYVQVQEAWYIKRQKEDDITGVAPSQCVDRREAVIVVGETKNGLRKLTQREILRDGGMVRLEEPTKEDYDGFQSVISQYIF